MRVCPYFFSLKGVVRKNIRFFDMFSGIGGFREGLNRAGGFSCVGHCEIDKYADRSYRAIFNTEGEWFCNDAKKIRPEELPEFDLLCGGFPCQAFSVAGKRQGFEDARGTLFFEIARLVKARRPPYLLLENVPGLLSHNKGATFNTILYTSKGLPVFCTVHRKTESLIKADIWERGFPAILTSGTLKAGESFQRSEQLNGLEDVGRVREYQADSPFDYDENCLLYMPRRKRKVYDSYHGEIRFLSEQIRKLVCSTFGHTLVLFTSYSMMGNVYRELRGNLPFPLLKVWKDSQSVIREFKAQKNCVLFAAGSCWEGVDFPGDVVSSLIIVRLPFAVPDPVREAERERYQTLKEYIQKIIVPDMQIKLRQGFGRAIRTETDTCVVSILDSRAGRGGKYHKEVIDALPVCQITDRMADVENFIRNRKRIEYYM